MYWQLFLCCDYFYTVQECTKKSQSKSRCIGATGENSGSKVYCVVYLYRKTHSAAKKL